VVALLIAVFVGGQFLGQPFLLGFVETDSMAPTLEPGDGFIAIPAAVAGEPEPGDVVVYDAEELHGGGLVTHRVVGTRSDGYITRGDANPFTDQDNVEPPVANEQITAHLLQVGGSTVVIPELGTAVTTTREAVDLARDRFVASTGLYIVGDGQAVLRGLAIAALVAYLLIGSTGNETRTYERSATRRNGVDARVVALGLVVVVLLGPTVSAVGASGSQQFSVDTAPNDPTAVAPGETKTGQLVLANGGYIPMTVRITSADPVRLSTDRTRLQAGERLNATATLVAPETPGRYQWAAHHYWYPAVLPSAVGDWLFGVHPWLPLVVVDFLVGIIAYVVARWALGSGQVRLDERGLGLVE
jgi:signal peptidase